MNYICTLHRIQNTSISSGQLILNCLDSRKDPALLCHAYVVDSWGAPIRQSQPSIALKKHVPRVTCASSLPLYNLFYSRSAGKLPFSVERVRRVTRDKGAVVPR